MTAGDDEAAGLSASVAGNASGGLVATTDEERALLLAYRTGDVGGVMALLARWVAGAATGPAASGGEPAGRRRRAVPLVPRVASGR